jgi:hypothetical protein
MITSIPGTNKSPRTRRRAWSSILLALTLPALVSAAGCASTRATVKAYGRDSTLRLEDPVAWSRFQVAQTSFKKRISFRDLATGESWETKYKGRATSWITPVGIFVPEKYYKHRSVRGNFRLEHPFTHRPLVLRARALSQSAGTVPFPTDAGAPVIEILDGDDQPVRGTLTYDVHSLVVFSGKIDGHEVEIVQQDRGAQRPDNPLEYMVAPFPLAGEFAVRTDGEVAARFLKRVPAGTTHSYELGVLAELPPEERDQAAVAFLVFVLMEEFVEATV